MKLVSWKIYQEKFDAIQEKKNASRKLIKWLAALCEIAAEQFLYIFW